MWSPSLPKKYPSDINSSMMNLKLALGTFGLGHIFNGSDFDCSVLFHQLTDWGWVTHICVSKLTIISSDNGLSPTWRQAIIWTNAGILLIGPLGANLSEILIAIYTFRFKKMHFKMSSGKWRPLCFDLSVLNVPHNMFFTVLFTYLSDMLWYCSFWL